MNYTLSRDQYDQHVRTFLCEHFVAPAAEHLFTHQYPKSVSTGEVQRELAFRGVIPPEHLPDVDYSAAAIDRLVEQLSAAGEFTVEALTAMQLGMTLSEYRVRVANKQFDARQLRYCAAVGGDQ